MVIQVPTPLLSSHLQILYPAQDRYVQLAACYLPHSCIEELYHLALPSRYEEKIQSKEARVRTYIGSCRKHSITESIGVLIAYIWDCYGPKTRFSEPH